MLRWREYPAGVKFRLQLAQTTELMGEKIVGYGMMVMVITDNYNGVTVSLILIGVYVHDTVNTVKHTLKKL